MKTIKYKTLVRNANTEYRETSAADKKWVLDQAQRLSDLARDCSQSSNSDLRAIGAELTKPNKDLIRQGTGAFNSIKTLVDGVLKNMKGGGQRDFSDRTCKGLQQAFDRGAEIFNNIEQVEWDAVDHITSEPVAMDPPQTTLSDLWATEVWEETHTITRRRIK